MVLEGWRELMERQHHVFTRDQAEAAGVSRHQLAWRVQQDYWQRVHPRVYADSPAPLSRPARLKAALLWVGEGSLLSHTTAAAEWGLRVPADHLVHLSVPAARSARAPAGVVVRRCTEVREAARRGGLLVTSLERSLLDAASILRHPADRRALVADCFQRRLTTSDRVLPVLDCTPVLRHRAELRRTILLAAEGSHSGPEMDYLLFFRRQGLPEPQRQYAVWTLIGKVYLDLSLPELLLDIEIDGRDGHLSEADRQRDLRRDTCLAALGWLVLRFTRRRLETDPVVVADEIRAVIDHRQRSARLVVDSATPGR